ncbi:MAG: hypothetical protein ACLPJY_12800, partial [Rhodomicrobium sp.]
PVDFAATQVLGQGGSFTVNTANDGGLNPMGYAVLFQGASLGRGQLQRCHAFMLLMKGSAFRLRAWLLLSHGRRDQSRSGQQSYQCSFHAILLFKWFVLAG